ncbi:hypothetical protein [Streptomyces sp. NPDC051129]|uniref:hypothetical protein n=1 Tax=Streptomyces sp. NPDC051129 TaxID=3154639 RepID=UPI0034208633
MSGHSSTVPYDDLDALRRAYMEQIITTVSDSGHLVRITPYLLAHSPEERRADLAQLRTYAVVAGIVLTREWFADAGQPPLALRSGWQAARRHAEQGFAHGIVAVARPAITTDPVQYAAVLDDLYAHRVFLALLPTEHDTLPPLPFHVRASRPGAEGAPPAGAGLYPQQPGTGPAR